MVLSGNEFQMAANTEHSRFEQIMAVVELREKILEHHLGSWQSLSNLARASQTMFKYIESSFVSGCGHQHDGIPKLTYPVALGPDQPVVWRL